MVYGNMNARRWGIAAIDAGTPSFPNIVRLEPQNLGLSIYGTRCFMAYTIIFFGKHILHCVLTSTLFDIPWLVPHDVFDRTLGFRVGLVTKARPLLISITLYHGIRGMNGTRPAGYNVSTAPYQRWAEFVAMLSG